MKLYVVCAISLKNETAIRANEILLHFSRMKEKKKHSFEHTY